MSSGQLMEVFRAASQAVGRSLENICACRPLYTIVAILWPAKAATAKMKKAMVNFNGHHYAGRSNKRWKIQADEMARFQETDALIAGRFVDKPPLGTPRMTILGMKRRKPSGFTRMYASFSNSFQGSYLAMMVS